MSTGEMSERDVLTSKSESMAMDLSETNIEKNTEELQIVYSNVHREPEECEQIGPLNVVKSSLQIVAEINPLTDRLGIIAENNSGGDNAVTKITEKISSDNENEVECLGVSESNFTADQVKENNAITITNLTESTFGLITEYQRTDNFAPIVKNSNNSQSSARNDATPAEKEAMKAELDKQIDKTCLKDLEKNLQTGQKKETTIRVELKNGINSLSCLATEYASSDSEEDERAPSPCEVITIVDDSAYKTQNKTDYRSKPIDDDSTNEDTDSDSDTSDESDSDSDSKSDSDTEDGPETLTKSQPSKMKKTKSEFEDLPPIEELKITVPEELCDRLGVVSGIVEQLVIVRPISGKPTLNLDTVLFLEKGHRVLGQIFDVFGQVADPHYCIRFNSQEHIKQSEIVLGMEVYYSPTTEHTSLVFLHELVKLKGIDVSGEDDNEPPEFSDDEEERAYNQLQRQKQRQNPGINKKQENSDAEELSQKRQCPDRRKNPWSSDWRSHNYNNPRSNRNFGQGSPRWNSENSQPPFQNSFEVQNPGHPSNQPLPNQYGPSNTFNAPQYQYNPYNSPYQQNMYPSPDLRYAFGRPPAFRPDFHNYGPNLYRPNQYPPPPMSWMPQPPPPPPPPSM